MKRITYKELRDRLVNHISEFGDAPLRIEDNCLLATVEDEQSVMLISANEAPDEERLKLMKEHDIEFEDV